MSMVKKRLQMLDDVGHRLTDMISTVEIAQKLHIKVRLDTLENKLLETKNIVNQIKSIEIEGGESMRD